MSWNDGLRNGYGFPDSFRTRITERKQKEGIFISQFENTFIIYRANLHLMLPKPSAVIDRMDGADEGMMAVLAVVSAPVI